MRAQHLKTIGPAAAAYRTSLMPFNVSRVEGQQLSSSSSSADSES